MPMKSKMSSIPQQETVKPAPKSPIPRSRSGFSCTGLTSRDKRWTTDFSLLLPAFSRDSTGYSRLTETPVTFQPKAKNQNSHIPKSPTVDSAILCQNQSTENKALRRCSAAEQTLHKQGHSGHVPVSCKTRQPLSSCPMLDSNRPLKHESIIRRSPTMDPKVLGSSTCNVPTTICRSPTLDPNILSRNKKEVNRWPPESGSSHDVNRSPLWGRLTVATPAEVVRSQSLRSLKSRPVDKSPLKIRYSESVQNDVGACLHKPSTLIEADEFDEEDIRRLRNFSVTPKGLINWGDSFRSHSLTSVPGLEHSSSHGGSQWDVASTRSYPMAFSQSQLHCSHPAQRYKVAIMGADEVGKTSLIRQFQTSEYICAFDTNYDVKKDYAITVILNEEESELEFIEYRSPDDEPEDQDKDVDSAEDSNIPFADAHVIIYSVTNRRSFLKALKLVSTVQRMFRKSAVLLVGNKSDLVRVRAVTSDEGQTAAKEKDCPFIETSAAINHQVDELLVSILTRIRIKRKADANSASRWSYSSYSFSRAKGLIKKFLKKACFQSKSCDNLQRL